MSKKRFTVAVYDENVINGFTVLDLEKPNSSKRLKYENVYIGSKVSCEIVCNFGNSLAEENEQLKQQLKSIEDSFKFSCTENHIEFNKDTLKVEDTHTELTLEDGKLRISVFIPQINEYVKFFYCVTGRKMEREFINYEGDV